MPSEISTDEWGEVIKYSKVLDEDARRKERDEQVRKQ